MAEVTLTDRLRVLQQFTSDRQVLLTAIKNFRPQDQILQSGAPAAESHGVADGPGSGAVSASVALAGQAVQAFADLQIGYNIERRTIITLEALRALARMLGGLPGRKNVVWLTAASGRWVSMPRVPWQPSSATCMGRQSAKQNRS